ncbi:hypothetical protein BKA57DRAFT_455492, partial [Linnemannia elongata]
MLFVLISSIVVCCFLCPLVFFRERETPFLNAVWTQLYLTMTFFFFHVIILRD